MSADLGLRLPTPERVALDLPLAGIGSRAAAYLVDFAVLLGAWLVAYFVLTLVTEDPLALWTGVGSTWQVVLALAAWAAQWVYWTAFEVFGGGRTPGKRAAGIRVVRVDGSPVGVLESAIRNLVRAVDFLPALYAVGAVSVLLTPRHRRLGDLAAGTLVIRDEVADLSRYVSRGAAVEVGVATAISPADSELMLAFVSRQGTMDPEPRRRLANLFLIRYGAELPAEEREAIAADLGATENYLRHRAGLR